MLTHAAWRGMPGLRHGFLDRIESQEPSAAGDLSVAAGVALPLVRARQVHGARTLLAGEVTPGSEADAVVATARGIAVGIVTADCAPILLRDRRGRAVAAVHAGWRGAAAGVLDSALERLRATAGVETDEVEMAIGPTVGGCCYCVGDEVRAAFAERGTEVVAESFTARAGSLMLDLRRALAVMARRAGIPTIGAVGPCTRCSPAYASYRRDGADAGRQLSFIALA